jgi:hypothetical protein
MPNAKADIIDPDTDAPVATFTESCQVDGTATAEVVLVNPIVLEETGWLAIFASGNDTPAIIVNASDPAGTSVTQFGGSSAIGCIPIGTKISLTKSPGGDLSTLILVLGWGSIQPC